MTALQYYTADNSHFKYIGRTVFQDNILWLVLSGSGIEFDFHGKHLELLLQGDDNATSEDRPEPNKARIAVLIDGIRVIDDMLTASEKCYSLIDSAAYKNKTNDEKVYSMKFNLHQESDGYVVDFHPSPRTHQKSAWVLVQKIKEIMNW